MTHYTSFVSQVGWDLGHYILRYTKLATEIAETALRHKKPIRMVFHWTNSFFGLFELYFGLIFTNSCFSAKFSRKLDIFFWPPNFHDITYKTRLLDGYVSSGLLHWVLLRIGFYNKIGHFTHAFVHRRMPISDWHLWRRLGVQHICFSMKVLRALTDINHKWIMHFCSYHLVHTDFAA